MLPVMIGALISMLEGLPALGFLYLGFPIAVVIASIWTYIFTQRHVAEIRIRSDAIAVRSVWDTATPARGITWVRLLDLSDGATKSTITAGYDMHTIYKSEWQDYESLFHELQGLLERTRSAYNS